MDKETNIDIQESKDLSDIRTIAELVAEKLSIDKEQLLTIIDKYEIKNGKIIFNSEHQPLLLQIEELLNKDNEIKKFDDKIKNSSQSIITNFNLLKNNLGKLQILVLIKNLESSKNNDELLNSFISILNDKLVSVNSIMESGIDKQINESKEGISNKTTPKTENVILTGGGNIINYKHLYIKYKNKYFSLKYNKLIIL